MRSEFFGNAILAPQYLGPSLYMHLLPNRQLQRQVLKDHQSMPYLVYNPTQSREWTQVRSRNEGEASRRPGERESSKKAQEFDIYRITTGYERETRRVLNCRSAQQ